MLFRILIHYRSAISRRVTSVIQKITDPYWPNPQWTLPITPIPRPLSIAQTFYHGFDRSVGKSKSNYSRHPTIEASQSWDTGRNTDEHRHSRDVVTGNSVTPDAPHLTLLRIFSELKKNSIPAMQIRSERKNPRLRNRRVKVGRVRINIRAQIWIYREISCISWVSVKMANCFSSLGRSFPPKRQNVTVSSNIRFKTHSEATVRVYLILPNVASWWQR